MSKFQTKPKSHFLVLLPTEGPDNKQLKWIYSLCETIISEHKLSVASLTQGNYPELNEYIIDKSTESFCEQNNDLVILVPDDTNLYNLQWFDSKKHRLVVYGFKKSSIMNTLIFDLCDAVLWMDHLPDSISTTKPTYEITSRSKAKWKKFVSYDWGQCKPNNAAIEFCDLMNSFINQIHESKVIYEKNLDLLKSTYREEIKAWSESALDQTSKSNPTNNSQISALPQHSDKSSLNKKLHAKEVYIKDLETRLDRYENQTLSVVWHQIKQFFNVIIIRLPLTLCLLAYHIFSTYYHRYKTSTKPL